MKSEAEGSRALTGAMRALQDRIRSLETDNEHLARSLSAFKDKSAQDENAWKTRLRDLSKAANDTENAFKTRIIDLENSVNSSQVKINELTEQLKISEGVTKVNQMEIRRLNEQIRLERENWKLEKTALEEKIQEKCEKEGKLGKRMEMMEKREIALMEQLTNTEKARKTACEEANFLKTEKNKEISAVKKQFSALESKLTSQNQSLQRQVQSLELQNEKLQKLAAGRLEETTNLRKETKKPHIRSGTSGKKRENSITRVKSALTERNKPTEDTIFVNEDELVQKIAEIESEIASEEGNYRAFLAKSQEKGADLASIRVKLDSIAGHMERLSSELLEMKRHRVELARRKRTDSSR